LVSAEEEDVSGDLEFEDVSEEWWNSEEWDSEDWRGSEDWEDSEDWEGSEDWEDSEDWSEDWDPSRTYGPDALTEAYGKHIPQTCIDFPFGTTTVKRCYYTYVPESCSDSDLSVEPLGQKKALPLVLDMHGHGGNPLDSAGYSGWMQQAEQHCFVVVWPAGISPSGNYDGSSGAPCWNLPGLLQKEPEDKTTSSDDETDDVADVTTTVPCCCFDEEETVTGMPFPDHDDPLFLKTVVETVAQDFETNSTNAFSIDGDRVYMAGHSNGCMTSLAMAALHSDTVAAVCCHAGALITPFEDPSYSPVPIWMVVGVEDEVIPYHGRPILPNTSPFGTMGFWSVPNTLEYLSHRNGCSEQENDVLLETNDTGNAGTVYRRKSCRNNATVEIVALDQVGHDPYLEGGTDIDTTAMAWEFCSAHVRSKVAAVDPEDDGDEGDDDDTYRSYNETELETIDWTSVKAAAMVRASSSSSSAPMRQRLGYESGAAISVAMLLLWLGLL